ncbi:MAG: hypothetical protein EGR04_04230 [Blautia sp.]|nr:hypothetical protein [Blautia sp.]
MMSGIYGANCSECFAKLEPHGLWQRMYQDYYQVKMDGSLEEFLGTWPKQGVMRGGIAFQPTLPAQDFGVSVSPLWQRPIASDKLEAMIDAIEGDIFNAEDKEISSTKIGEIVMSHLKDLDSVAYVRFASVYREFKDVSTFMDELKKFLN